MSTSISPTLQHGDMIHLTHTWTHQPHPLLSNNSQFHTRNREARREYRAGPSLSRPSPSRSIPRSHSHHTIPWSISLLLPRVKHRLLIRRWQRLQLPPPHRNLLLLEIPPVLLIHQHEVEIVAHTEFIMNVLVRRRQLIR